MTNLDISSPLADRARKHLLRGLERSIGKILEQLMETVNAERGVLVFMDDHHIYRGAEEHKLQFPFSSKVVETLLEDGIGLVSFDPDKGEAPSSSIKLYGLRSAMAEMVEDEEGLLGILYCDTRCNAKAFSESELAELKSLCGLLAPAMRLHMDLRGA